MGYFADRLRIDGVHDLLADSIDTGIRACDRRYRLDTLDVLYPLGDAARNAREAVGVDEEEVGDKRIVDRLVDRLRDRRGEASPRR